MTLQERITRRVSVRTYSDDPLPAGLETSLKRMLKQPIRPPFRTRARFHLLKKLQVEQDKKLKLGTYGFIKNARYFIIGATTKQTFSQVDYGFQLEKIILDLTDFELGTCWLGGTFRRYEFETAIGLQSNEMIPAVTPVGYPADKRRLAERLIRRVAGSHSRKAWPELFYQNEGATPLTPNDAGLYEPLFEWVRLAPSASNRQPWRIVKSDTAFHFFLSRTPGYRQQLKAADLQHVDMGIAMCHWQLGAQELRIDGRWTRQSPPPRLESEHAEYIASWET